MMIVVAGGSGFLGRRLAIRLAADGHTVRILTRRPATSPDAITWNPNGFPGALPAQLEGTDAVINLAGENLAGGRWTAKRKEVLLSSRVLPTRTLAHAIAACAKPPRVFISGSGVGYYGPHGDEPVTEATPAGADFMARICVDWEQEARAVAAVTRLAIVRTAVVLAKGGGALQKMLLPFKLGLGATVGSGTQFFPWIHAQDWVSLVSWLVDNDTAVGAFNAAAPEPVTNRAFAKTLGRVLGRPVVLKAPAFAMHLALGEMADMLLHGQRVMPVHAEQLGFQFTHRALEPALHSLHL